METELSIQIVSSLGDVLSTTIPALIAAVVGLRFFKFRRMQHDLNVAMKDILVLRKIWSEYADRFKEINPDEKSEYYQVKDSAELDMGFELTNEFTPIQIRQRFLHNKLEQSFLDSIDKNFPIK